MNTYNDDVPYSGSQAPDINRCVPVRIGGTVQEILAANPVGSLVHRIHDEAISASVRRTMLKMSIKKAASRTK